MNLMHRSEPAVAEAGVVLGLRRELAAFVSEADKSPAMAALLDGTAGRDLYIAFLVQTRHYVTRTYPVLAAAGVQLKALGRHPVLADLFAQKAEEEDGHDILIDNDLRALGVDPGKALATGPGRWVQAYNAWIEAVAAGEHPPGFLGSAYVLEGLAVQRAGVIARALRTSGKIEGIEKAVSFLELHAEADIGHVEDLESILADLVDAPEQQAIGLTAAATRTAYIGMLDEVALSARH